MFCAAGDHGSRFGGARFPRFEQGKEQKSELMFIFFVRITIIRPTSRSEKFEEFGQVEAKKQATNNTLQGIS